MFFVVYDDIKSHFLEIQENTRAIRETQKDAALAYETGKIIVNHLHSRKETHHVSGNADIEQVSRLLQKGMGLQCF